MTYEDYLDEVTTLIFERFGLKEHAAIALVMKAQADGFFSPHDDDPALRTLERAQQDAKAVFTQYGKPPAPPKPVGPKGSAPPPARGR